MIKITIAQFGVCHSIFDRIRRKNAHDCQTESTDLTNQNSKTLDILLFRLFTFGGQQFKVKNTAHNILEKMNSPQIFLY